MKKSSLLLRIWKLAASLPSRLRTLLLPLASGSVTLRFPILTGVTVFSAMVLAERVMAVGGSLTSVMDRAKAVETGVLPGRVGSLTETVKA